MRLRLHSHSLRRTALLVVSVTLTALVVGLPTAAPADLQDVTLTCSDGTNLNLGLAPASVMQLTDAVNAMALDPAGDPPLTCGVANVPLLPSTASGSSQTGNAGNPTYDYAVGGGKAPNLGCFGGFPTSFGLSAHVRSGSPPDTASGTFNVGSPAPNVGCKGHFNSKVDCLMVAGTAAHLTAHVTQATGQFAGLDETEIDVWVQDNGTPSALMPDLIDDGNTEGRCLEGKDAQGEPTAPDTPVTNGNISVHSAG
jgi:hypothetical protein